MNIPDIWRRTPRIWKIILSKVALIIPQVFGVMLVTFILVRLLPGDPARLILGNFATEESIAIYRERLGLDQPILVQFAIYLRNVLGGDLGTSPFTSKPILSDLISRAPATLELITYAMILTLLAGVTIAVSSVVKPNGAIAFGAKVYGFAAGAIPDFWMALILIFVFFYLLGWAPAPFGRLDPMISAPPTVTGFYTIDALLAGNLAAFGSAVARLVLPVVTITAVNTGALMKMAQTAFADIYRSDFINHLRASGVPEKVIRRAALRNSLPPIITIGSFTFGFLLGAAVLVETIFAWGGLGQYAVQSVINSDYAALQGFVLIASVFILIVYAAADLLYEIVDPRIRI